MNPTENRPSKCQICGRSGSHANLLPGSLVRPAVADEIRKDFPAWNADGLICQRDLDRYRTRFVEALLQAEKGELTKLEQDVLKALESHETIAQHLDVDYEEHTTFGHWLADHFASFGGSWKFIIAFACVLISWIVINSLALASRPFDPYPFILLNLILSCLAAIQAPIIMMSQNRLEAKDRLRAEHDYRVNLKAELEIRNLHDKMDHLLRHQWERLVEIQQVQLEILGELREKRR